MYCYCKCYVDLPHGARIGLQCVIVVFPDHTHCLIYLEPENKNRPAMTIAVDLGRKATKPTNQLTRKQMVD